jgi:hypothetical protein
MIACFALADLLPYVHRQETRPLSHGPQHSALSGLATVPCTGAQFTLSSSNGLGSTGRMLARLGTV